MRRFVSLTALSAGALLLVAVLCVPAAAGPSKSFGKYGFTWTMPSGEWQFKPVTPTDIKHGTVARAECLAASVEAYVYTKPAEGLSLGERVGDVKDYGSGGLGTVVRTKVMDTTLSGVKGKVVIQKVKADSAQGHFRTYVIVSDGNFYQMLIRTWHGAHESAKDEVNGVRKGFRLIKGAGGPDSDESLAELDKGHKASASDDEDDDDSDDGDDDYDDDEEEAEEEDNLWRGGDWPASGPKREGRKICFPTQNVEWTIPTGPFFIVQVAPDETAKDGLFMVLRGRLERKKKEFEKDTPDENECQVELRVFPSVPGRKPVDVVKSSHIQEQIREKVLDSANNQKTRTKEDYKIGNHEGAYVMMEGQKDGDRATFLFIRSSLRGKSYEWQVTATGHTDNFRQFAKPFSRLMKGVKFIDTNEPQGGPLLSIIKDYAWKRGKGAGKETSVNGPGYTFTKPPELAQIEAGAQELSMNRDFRHAFEGRSKDGKAYLYFEIRSYKLNQSRGNVGIPNPEPETFIEKRGQAWLAGAGDEASIGGKKGDRLKFKNGKFGLAKGLTYEFTGHLDDAPFVEQGWVAKFKQNLYWFKLQYGGEEAEKGLKKLIKAVKKGLKFKK